MRPPASATAIVLSGGGAFGAFAIGIMKGLFAGASPATGYQPLEVGIYSGASVGAFNATCMVCHPDTGGMEAILRLERIWRERIAESSGPCGNGVFRIRGNPAEYLDARCLRRPTEIAERFAADGLAAGRYILSRTANFLASPAALLDRTAAIVNVGSLVDANPFLDLVRTSFQEDEVRTSNKRLNVVATNWSTGVPEYFSNADFHDGRGHLAVAASAAIPGFFSPVNIGRQTYVDGGVTENTPLKRALKAGAVELHVIYLDPEPELIPLRGDPNSIDTLLRVYFLMLAGKLNEDVATARWINEGLRALRDFERGESVPTSSALAFGRVAAKVMQANYKLATVHRYFPKTVLGGDFGMLDYRLENIAQIIHQGENVAVTHDCQDARCIAGDIDPHA